MGRGDDRGSCEALSEIWGHPICDQLHQNESHVANTVFELAADKRQRGDIYHF